ncbi:MAG: response regulator [Alphaproteobacteria bacterium]|nr:response regulator [Alphaproteobacteria bacterium]
MYPDRCLPRFLLRLINIALCEMAYDFKDVKVLVVESSAPLFTLLKSVLQMFTVRDKNVSSAFSMEEGWERFRTGDYDLVIVDWLDTPDRGIHLTQEIRTNKQSPNPYVPILMTAGSGHKNRVRRARDAGISDYLVKPFTAKTLANKITRIVEHPRPFVNCEGYMGPDRRSHQVTFEGEDRRLYTPELNTLSADISFRKKDGVG